MDRLPLPGRYRQISNRALNILSLMSYSAILSQVFPSRYKHVAAGNRRNEIILAKNAQKLIGDPFDTCGSHFRGLLQPKSRMGLVSNRAYGL